VSAWGYCGNSYWYWTSGTDCRACSDCPDTCAAVGHNSLDGNDCSQWVSRWGFCGSSWWHRELGADCTRCCASGGSSCCPERCAPGGHSGPTTCLEYVSPWGYCGTTFWHMHGGTSCANCAP
jgi:hypothetical protein